MLVKVLKECGYEEALFGLGLSYGKTFVDHETCLQRSGDDVVPYSPADMERTAHCLAGLGGGEDKFLRQICIWVYIKAPMFWWKQMDTYKVATVAQSESQMHTLMKTPITNDNFEYGLPEHLISHFENLRQSGNFRQLENDLSQGWLQGRVVSLNYAVLGNIIWKRKSHKLQEWKKFCGWMSQQIKHPELLDRFWAEKGE